MDKIKELNINNFDTIINNEFCLVDFWADWCMPCKMQLDILKNLSNKVDINIYKLNVDEYKEISEKYNIINLPTFILFNKSKILKQFSGIQTEQNLLNIIKEHYDLKN